MVAGEQDVGDAPASKIRGTGVLRAFEEALRERVLSGGIFVAEDAWNEAGHGIDEYGGGDCAIGQNVIANGDLFVNEMVDDSLIDAFIMAAQQDEVASRGGEAGGYGVAETATGGGEIEDARWGGDFGFDGLDGSEDGFAFHDHPLAAAVRGIVGGGVFVRGPVAQVVDADIQQAFFAGALEHALAEGAFADGGEESQDVDAHGREPGGTQNRQ